MTPPPPRYRRLHDAVGHVPRWSGWALLALSVTAYAVASLAMHQPFHDDGLRLRDFDLHIYRIAAERLWHGQALYGTPMLHGLGFTYPPFAALVLAPLAGASLGADAIVVCALNVGLLVVVLRRVLVLADARGDIRRPAAWALAAGLGAAALWLEPVSVTLGYGQINLLITALVVVDLSRPDSAQTKGVGVGLAAALKLTPLLFIAYLLFSGRIRAAAVAAATFTASVALSLAVAPRDTVTYWGHRLLQTSRVGSPRFAGDQSLHGLIARFAGVADPTGAATLIAAAVAVAGLALAVAAARRGDEAAGFSLAALTALLVSPISWSHHWTLAVPALVLLGRRAHERRSPGLATATVVITAVACAYLPELAETHFQTVRGLASLPATDPYPLVALAALAGYAAAMAAVGLRRRRPLRLRPVAAARALDHGLRMGT